MVESLNPSLKRPPAKRIGPEPELEGLGLSAAQKAAIVKLLGKPGRTQLDPRTFPKVPKPKSFLGDSAEGSDDQAEGDTNAKLPRVEKAICLMACLVAGRRGNSLEELCGVSRAASFAMGTSCRSRSQPPRSATVG